MTAKESKAVASVCLIGDPELYAHGEFASVQMQLFGGYEPKIGDKLVMQSALHAAEAESRIVALQSRLNGVPEIISGLEMANAALIGSDHAHRDIQKAIDFLRSAALGGESRGDGEVES